MSVISSLPEPASCTILSPVYGSPLTVSSSKTIWLVELASVPSSKVIPPFTTETFASALPELNVTSSPMA